MWRIVGVRMGLLRHDMEGAEVEGVVVKDDAVLELRVRCCTCNAQALSQEYEAWFHEYCNAGCSYPTYAPYMAARLLAVA